MAFRWVGLSAPKLGSFLAALMDDEQVAESASSWEIAMVDWKVLELAGNMDCMLELLQAAQWV